MTAKSIDDAEPDETVWEDEENERRLRKYEEEQEKELKASEPPGDGDNFHPTPAPATEKEIAQDATKQKVTKKGKKETGKDAEEPKPIRISFMDDGNILVEQVLRDRINQYAVWDCMNQRVTYTREYIKHGKTYAPHYGEEIEKGFIYLPSGIEEYGDDSQLEEEIKRFVRKWLDVDEEHLQYAIWNTMKSWVYDKFRTVSYLRALGDYGQGKSRYLQTLGLLHYKPIITSGATTAAPLFRIVEKWHGSLLIDEGDLKQSDETNDIIKIVNLGFEKGHGIMRCDSYNLEVIHFFDPYCPKIIVSRKRFEDKATESRCFTYDMKGTDRKDIPFELDSSFFEEAQRLRNKLLLWRFRNYKKIDISKFKDVDLGDIEPRLKQIHQSFTALFNHDEEKLMFFKEYLLKRQHLLIAERRNTLDGTIVEAMCRLVFQKNRKDIAPNELVEEADLKDSQGYPLSPISIGKNLKELGLDGRKTRTIGGKTKNCIVWDEITLHRLAKRYGIDVTKQVAPRDIPPW